MGQFVVKGHCLYMFTLNLIGCMLLSLPFARVPFPMHCAGNRGPVDDNRSLYSVDPSLPHNEYVEWRKQGLLLVPVMLILLLSTAAVSGKHRRTHSLLQQGTLVHPSCEAEVRLQSHRHLQQNGLSQCQKKDLVSGRIHKGQIDLTSASTKETLMVY